MFLNNIFFAGDIWNDWMRLPISDSKKRKNYQFWYEKVKSDQSWQLFYAIHKSITEMSASTFWEGMLNGSWLSDKSKNFKHVLETNSCLHRERFIGVSGVRESLPVPMKIRILISWDGSKKYILAYFFQPCQWDQIQILYCINSHPPGR